MVVAAPLAATAAAAAPAATMTAHPLAMPQAWYAIQKEVKQFLSDSCSLPPAREIVSILLPGRVRQLHGHCALRDPCMVACMREVTTQKVC